VCSNVARDDLLGACRALFGAATCVDHDFLARLDVDKVRRRFRERAVEVHPDRAAVLRRHPAALAEAFKQLEAAYRTLSAHLAAPARAASPARDAPSRPPPRPDPGPTRPARQPGSAARGRPSPSRPGATDTVLADHFWAGPIPPRTLRLGEFLYYSGRISWLDLIGALVWQARQRPYFGQVARRFGYLTPDRLAAVLARRRALEKIGEAAVRLRFISSQEQQVILHAQQWGGRRIGDYFLEAGLLRAPDLEHFGRRARAHNLRVGLAR